ncbi:MAG: FAD-binding oxidoreductase [Archangium sp.]
MNLLDTLRAHVRGEVVAPADGAFRDVSKIFNRAAQHTPLAVVRCRDTADVVTVLRVAGDAGVPISVRSGGHSPSGRSVGEGAVVIDLRAIDSFSLDERTHVATVGGGIGTTALTQQVWARDRFVSTGFEPRVGFSGALLGGGYGLGVRRFGLACDSLVAAEVVLADGRVVVADAERESDLFWALRGAGAHFGVVTRLEVKTHPMPPLVFATARFGLENAEHVLTRYAELLPSLGRDTMAYLTLGPDRFTGPSLGLLGFHFGDEAAAKKALRPMQNLARPLLTNLDQVAVADVHVASTFIDSGFPEDHHNEWATAFFDDARGACDALAHFAASSSNITSAVWCLNEHLGGAMGDLAPDATAFALRSAQVGLVTTLKWHTPAERPDALLALQRKSLAAVISRSIGRYPNYVADGNYDSAYGANLPRLRALKTKFDPAGRFGRAFL